MAKKKLTLEDMLVPVDEIPYEVPENWCWVKYESVIENVSSSSKKIKQKDYLKEGMFPVIDQGSDLIGGYTSDENLLYDGELPVIIFGDHTRCFKYIDFKFAQGADGVKVLKVKPGIDTKYMYYLMLNLELPNKGYSRHYKFLKEAKLQIPPLAEQERIVNRIESLFDKVDRAEELVDEARDGFEKRRAAILERAFSGELTKKWREKNGVNDEWEELSLDKLCSFKNGLSKRSGKEGADIKVLRLADIDIKNYKVYCDESRVIKLTDKEIEKYEVKSNDLLLIRVNGSKSIVSKVVMYEGNERVAYCDHLIKITPDNKLILNKYLWYLMNSDLIRKILLDRVVSSAGQNTISQGSLNGIIVKLPTIEEQVEIISILDKLLNTESNIEELVEIDNGIDMIKKSILAKAFRGELGSNDLNEESSIELLKELIK